MIGALSRGRLLLWLAVLVVAPAVVTPVVQVASERVSQGWSETIGFTAGIIAAALVIAGLLRTLDARAGR